MRGSRTLLPAAALLAALGCETRGGDVRSYTVPKESAPKQAVPAAPVMQTPPRAPRGPMQWELPAGWAQIANPNSMRFATLSAGSGDEQIEVAITRLGGAAGGIAENIHRWRGQVGLSPVAEEELRRMAQPVRARGTQGVMVDLLGPAPDGSEDRAPRMLAAIFPTPVDTWFIKTVGPAAALERHRPAFLELCESVGFAGADGGGNGPRPGPAAPPARPGAETAPAWGDLPPGWTADTAPSPMSVVSFSVADAGQEAALTITPLAGDQDLLANVNRWRRQVGLGPLASLDEEPPAPVEVAGGPGHLVDIVGPSGHTLAVVSARGAMTWFYKLSGPDPLVASQRAAFEAFVRSLVFDGGADE